MQFKDYLSRRSCLLVALNIGLLHLATVAYGADWTQFRGPHGSGISSDTGVPLTWSDTDNLKWKTQLPGPGFSCPITVGDRLFVTCYTGYGLNAEEPGNLDSLTRHLVCLSRADGKILWTKGVASAVPDDKYEGFITEHGYASQSPVSDGQHVFVFFGKSGVLAFDRDGNQLWQTSVGTASGEHKWGSAASPILFQNLVIVNASDESASLVALDKRTGTEVWRETTDKLDSNWSTPVLVDGQDGAELVIAVLGEVWGFDPATGKRKWYARGLGERGYCTSLIADEGIVYCAGGMLGGPSFAIRTGGSGDVTDSHVLWTGQSFEAIISPVLHAGRLWGGTNRGIAYGVDAENGQKIFEARLATEEQVAEPPAASGRPRAQVRPIPRAQSGGQREGGKETAAGKPAPRAQQSPVGPPRPTAKRAPRSARPGGGRGGPGGGEYASPVLIGDKVFLITREGTTYVMAPSEKLEVLAKNELASDLSGFCATPAVGDGNLYIRSNKYLYCVSAD